jgi:cobalt-precorrin-5B (C1)-methyltransferase
VIEEFRNVNGKLLRRGYTTGSCAAAAAKAAALNLLSGTAPARVTITLPRGEYLTLDVESCAEGTAAVRKFSGDDPDVTDGMLIYASLTLTDSGVRIDGGEGVGRVTEPGLDQPVGAAAINSTPRRMIEQALSEAAKEFGYSGGFEVIVSVPGGAEIAARTFNPRMGIRGGISIIGTTGIVEPMSNKAIADTVRVELSRLKAAGNRAQLLLTPGNYGETFARETLRLSTDCHVNCSNCIGEAIDAAVELGFRDILLVGHIGKLVKLGIGITNTHSAFGDGRIETLTACALEAGAELETLRGISACVTADAALELLHGAGKLDAAMAVLERRISDTLRRIVPDGVELGYVCFSNKYGILIDRRGKG